MPEPLWRPSQQRVAQAALTHFSGIASTEAGTDLSDYFDLHEWSVRHPDRFWSLYARYAGLPFSLPAQTVISGRMPEVAWFEGARLNYARALLYPSELEDPNQRAILALDESGGERELSYLELRSEVARAQQALMAEGIGEGDRVAAFAANVPETLILLLACASLGAIFTSCSPDFGLEAAAARFGQVKPKLLAASHSYRYGGKRFDVSEVAQELAKRLGLERAVALPYPGEDTAPAGSLPWQEWLGPSAGEPSFSELPFDHPLYVLYSSGTTGLPKAIIHRAGGALLTHHKEHRLHSDIRPGDRVFYFSTCGWMMWNWLVSALAQAATVVLYEGAAGYPELGSLWRLAERHRFTFFGTSARYIHTLQAQGERPGRLNLESLKTIASTGSPLSPGGFEYVYRHIGEDLHLASISGGTDIVSCFMLGVPTLPVYSGEIQAAGLGVDLAAFDEEGRPVTGQPGELVCRRPLPSMPLGFWNDPEGERYRGAYFSRYPGVWRHGDLIEITERGGVVVYGRSDATLNPGGVRIGTAEIYGPLDRLAEVVEAAAVARREEGDESIWLFVVLAAGSRLDEELASRIRTAIREGASPRHVPKRIIAVPQLPRTRSGKAMELAVAAVANGREISNRSVIANPESLEQLEEALESTLE